MTLNGQRNPLIGPKVQGLPQIFIKFIFQQKSQQLSFFTQFSAAAHSKMTERVFRSVEVGNSIVINNRKPS